MYYKQPLTRWTPTYQDYPPYTDTGYIPPPPTGGAAGEGYPPQVIYNGTIYPYPDDFFYGGPGQFGGVSPYITPYFIPHSPYVYR
ncbi:hypothetical protein ACFFHM_12855 [Halalkalibacter kiskunsagensis]|uniref:Spore coat protein n=1 Tax=Halalkalibacter kiskunsagensis TaxID=1548599 RepID=A0ABV6KDG1_9BACI